MSWVLKNKKVFFYALVLIGVFISSIIVCKVTNHYELLSIPLVIFCIYSAICIDQKTISLLFRQYKVFSPNSNVRNVDCLVIGDLFDSSFCVMSNESFVQIAAPNRGFLSDYEIIRHTHSILKEHGGRIIIPFKARCINNDLYFFDLPFFHPITIQKYQLKEKLKELKHPFLYHPIYSFRFVLNAYAKKGVYKKDIDKRISEFCAERGYELLFVEID